MVNRFLLLEERVLIYYRIEYKVNRDTLYTKEKTQQC